MRPVSYALYLLTLAEVLAVLDRPEEARDQAQRAIHVEPTNQKARELLPRLTRPSQDAS